MRARAHQLVWALTLLLLACAARGGRPDARPARRTRLSYRVEVPPSLETLSVELCFEGTLWGGLIPGHAQAFGRLRGARWLGREARTLRAANGLLVVPEQLGEGCLRYELGLEQGGSLGALGALVQRVDNQLVAGVPAWLWRPRRNAEQFEAELRFVLPPGLRASVAFEPRGDGYRLDASAFAFDSYAAFGDFPELTLEVAGTRARLALLGPLPNLDQAALERWLRAQIQLAAQSDGHFPAPVLQLLVLPQPFGDEPFGNVARGGGASVLLLLPTAFNAAKLAQDWVLPHELSHLLLPFLVREDAWLAEGFATYYQEVLRARAGVIPAEAALANLASALRSAQHEGSGRTLCEESKQMHSSHAYRAVYWGGAGHWLNVDVALRASGAGVTLDRLLSGLRRDARLTPPYTARELLGELDRRAGTQLFSALLSHCQQVAFPAFEASLTALGASAENSPSPSATALRDALFAAQAPK